MGRWLDYFRAVGSRITWDRSLLRGLWIVPWLHFAARLNRATKRAQIAYYPQPAGPWYTLPLALAGSSIRRTSDMSKADVVMVFDDRTHSETVAIETSALLLNARATDISKENVGRIFEAVFGYALTVDPETYTGPIVEKSDENGVHDGRIVHAPLSSPRPGVTYQRLVDSLVRPGVTEDLRCVCVKGKIAALFRKEKDISKRFSASYLQTNCHEPEDYFSAEEQARIARFCEEIGLDFGSIDVLRDHAGEGRIYIVDVNKTCMPVLSMPARPLRLALDQIGRSLEAHLVTEIT